MAEKLEISASGAWALRYKNDYHINSSGYGNGGWSHELIEVATGNVVKTWSGSAHQSPWDSWSTGVSSVSWDGDLLVIQYPPAEGLHSESFEERISVEEALARKDD